MPGLQQTPPSSPPMPRGGVFGLPTPPTTPPQAQGDFDMAGTGELPPAGPKQWREEQQMEVDNVSQHKAGDSPVRLQSGFELDAPMIDEHNCEMTPSPTHGAHLSPDWMTTGPPRILSPSLGSSNSNAYGAQSTAVSAINSAPFLGLQAIRSDPFRSAQMAEINPSSLSPMEISGSIQYPPDQSCSNNPAPFSSIGLFTNNQLPPISPALTDVAPFLDANNVGNMQFSSALPAAKSLGLSGNGDNSSWPAPTHAAPFPGTTPSSNATSPFSTIKPAPVLGVSPFGSFLSSQTPCKPAKSSPVPGTNSFGRSSFSFAGPSPTSSLGAKTDHSDQFPPANKIPPSESGYEADRREQENKRVKANQQKVEQPTKRSIPPPQGSMAPANAPTQPRKMLYSNPQSSQQVISAAAPRTVSGLPQFTPSAEVGSFGLGSSRSNKSAPATNPVASTQGIKPFSGDVLRPEAWQMHSGSSGVLPSGSSSQPSVPSIVGTGSIQIPLANGKQPGTFGVRSAPQQRELNTLPGQPAKIRPSNSPASALRDSPSCKDEESDLEEGEIREDKTISRKKPRSS